MIGRVGSTGNAGPAALHLHFAVFVPGPEKLMVEGAPVRGWPGDQPPSGDEIDCNGGDFWPMA